MNRIPIVLTLILSAAIASATLAATSSHAKPGSIAASSRSQLGRALDRICPIYPAMTRRRCIQWVQVAQCETGGQQRRVTLHSLRQIRWRYNGRSGYDGALQFKPSTWISNVHRIAARKLTRPQRIARQRGRYNWAYNAPPSVQILAAEVLRVRIGGNPQQTAGWPHCGAWFYA